MAGRKKATPAAAAPAPEIDDKIFEGVNREITNALKDQELLSEGTAIFTVYRMRDGIEEVRQKPLMDGSSLYLSKLWIGKSGKLLWRFDTENAEFHAVEMTTDKVHTYVPAVLDLLTDLVIRLVPEATIKDVPAVHDAVRLICEAVEKRDAVEVQKKLDSYASNPIWGAF